MEPHRTSADRGKLVIRWIGVVPGAVLAVLVVLFPVHWFVMLQYVPNGEGNLYAIISPRTLEALLDAFFTPFIFIAVGSVIAPRYKLATGVILALLLVPLYVLAATYVLSDIHNGLYTPVRWFRLGATELLCVAGFALGLFQAKKGQKSLASG